MTQTNDGGATDLTTAAICASGQQVRALDAERKEGWREGMRDAAEIAYMTQIEDGQEATDPMWLCNQAILAALTPAPQPEAATPTAQETVLVALTYQQKLEALSLRFYQGMQWNPKAGDYYTTSRADLELYQVVEVENGTVKTRYCDQGKSDAVASWPVEEFTSAGFGPKRVYVPDFVLRAHPPQPSVSVAEAALKEARANMQHIKERLVGEWPRNGTLELIETHQRKIDAALRALKGEE